MDLSKIKDNDTKNEIEEMLNEDYWLEWLNDAIEEDGGLIRFLEKEENEVHSTIGYHFLSSVENATGDISEEEMSEDEVLKINDAIYEVQEKVFKRINNVFS